MTGAPSPPSRRKRRLWLTSGLALAFVAIAGAVVVLATRPKPEYRPGEKVEGLTSELSRTLPADYPRVTFVDVSRDAGLTFQHFSGKRSSQIPEDMGSGVAWGDYNRDGWPDAFLTNLVGPLTLTPAEVRQSPARCALFRNNGDGTFRDVTVEAGLDLRVWGMGAEWGDYDNDGWPDLVVATYGEVILFRNTGDGRFADRSRAAGLAGRSAFWSGVAWGDYDRDGFLDLYVTGYVKYAYPEALMASRYDVEDPASTNPNTFPPERNLLFHNGRNGRFTEVAAAAGVLGERGKSLEAAWSDLDEDGWPDLYVANDVTDNQLFRNLGNGTFADVSHPAAVADYRSAMGMALGDWDGDQDTDLFITHWIAQENALYGNLKDRSSGERNGAPRLVFADQADRYGLGQIALDLVGWGTFFFDYDNDGRPDLFVANGHTFQRRDAPHLLAPQRPLLFWNRGPEEGFYETSSVGGEYFSGRYVGRGAAYADYDRDGDLDILVVHHGGPAALLRNEGAPDNRWLRVELEGRRSNRMAVGARIRLMAGGRVQVREVGAQASYLSQNEPTEHFGLGSTTQVDSLVVLWPSGLRQVVTGVASNRTVRVVEGESAAADSAAVGAARADVRQFWETYRRATEHRVAGRTGDAMEAYRRAIELNPRHEDALYYLGNMELELGHFDEARSAWQRLADANPGSSRAHSRLGDLFACLEPGAPRDLARAEAEFRRALEINREETGPLLRLGEVTLIRGRLADAASHLDAVIGSNPRSVEAHFLRAYVAWKQGVPERGAALFGRAVELAKSAPAPQLAPGEGDAKGGLKPMVSQAARCRHFRAPIDSLSHAPISSVAGAMHRLYRQLDAELARFRPASRP
jgi:tetratricopeptide (TPR) repeat protein